MGRIHFRLSHWFTSNPKAITHHRKQEDITKSDPNYNHDGANHKITNLPFLSETLITTSPKLSVTSSNIPLISPNQSIPNSSNCISPKDHMNRNNIINIECNNAATSYTDHSSYHHPTNHDDCVFNQLIDGDEYDDDSDLKKIHGSLSHSKTRSEDDIQMNDKQKRKDGFDVRELERRLKALINEHPEPLGRRKYSAKSSTNGDNSPILSDTPPTPHNLINSTADDDQHYASMARRHSMDSNITNFSQYNGDLLHLGNDFQSRNNTVSTISTSTNSDSIFDRLSACASLATTFEYHGVSEISNVSSNQPSISSTDHAEDVVDLDQFNLHNYNKISDDNNCSDHNSIIRSAILRELVLSHKIRSSSKQPNADDDPISEQVNDLNATMASSSGSSSSTSYTHNSPILWDGIISRRGSEMGHHENDDGIIRRALNILPARPKSGNDDLLLYYNGTINGSSGHGHDDDDDDDDDDAGIMNVHHGDDTYLCINHSHDFCGKKDHGFDQVSRRRVRICGRKDSEVWSSTYIRCKERLLGARHIHDCRTMARLSGPSSSSHDSQVREPCHGPRQNGAGSEEEEEALSEGEDMDPGIFKILPTDFDDDDDDDDDHHHNARPLCRVSNSVAVVKVSHDPGRDFKESMLDMVASSRKSSITGGYSYSARDMVELLQCYLALNPDTFHGLIFNAFTEVWSEVFNQSSSLSR